jgi:predicted acylesterase/phospholipase RssA
MNKKIGLALGGGTVLGAAHVGVLKAIEENGKCSYSNLKKKWVLIMLLGLI